MAEAEKRAIVAELALQRAEMSSSRIALAGELSVSRQLKKSFNRKPTSWIVGGAVAALTLGLLFRRKKIIYGEIPIKRGFLGRTTRRVFSLARPALTTLAIKYVTEYAEAHFETLDDNSMLGGPSQK